MALWFGNIAPLKYTVRIGQDASAISDVKHIMQSAVLKITSSSMVFRQCITLRDYNLWMHVKLEPSVGRQMAKERNVSDFYTGHI